MTQASSVLEDYFVGPILSDLEVARLVDGKALMTVSK